MTTWNNQSKPNTTWQNMKKAGVGWEYDQSDITYDMTTDADGRTVYYNSIGVATSWSNQSKPATVWTNQSKS